MNVINFILSLGASVMLPIIIFVLGLVFGQKAGKAFRSALTIGIGFIGINLVIGLLTGNLGAASQEMVQRLGIQLDVIDVGWPAASAIAFASRIGALIIPVGLVVNIAMLLTRTTKTVNVDFWNYWHFAFTGALIVAATGSMTLGIVGAIIDVIIVLKIADWTAPLIQDFYQLPGISLPHGFSAAYVPIAIPLNKLIDKIPGLNKLDASTENIEKRFGIFGEPMVIGLILGVIIGFAAGYSIDRVLQLGMSMAAVMFLMPRMVKILMEGLIPLSESAREFMQKRFAGREFYIGLDSAVSIGHPAAISTALILVPVTILLALVIPGNRVLPFGDLATIPFMIAMIAPITKGNVVRSVIIGGIVIGVGLLIATNVAPLHTTAAIDAAFQMPAGASMISSICDGANPLTWIILQVMKIFA